MLAKLSTHWPLLAWFFLLVLGALQTPSFGISWDEGIQRQHRLVAMKSYFHQLGVPTWLPEDAKTMPHVWEYPFREYGSALQYPLLLLEYAPIGPNDHRFWMLSHGYTHSIFLLSVIAFFALVRTATNNRSLSFILTALYVVSPRIYAHSFYNIKDLLFLSTVTISMWVMIRYFQKPTWRWLIALAISLAFAMNTRLMGVLLVPMALFAIVLSGRSSISTIIRKSVLMGITAMCSLYLLWPTLWFGNPFIEFYRAMIGFGNYPWDGNNLFLGQIISAQNIPWYYTPVWMAVTVPLGVLVGWGIGLGFGVQKLVFASKQCILQCKSILLHRPIPLFLTLSSLFLVVSSFATIFTLNSSLYNGWRHLFYLHVPLTLLASLALARLYAVRPRLGTTIIALILFQLGMTLGWMWVNHPHYYVYFNQFARSNWHEQFDRDYWLLSGKQALEKVLELADPTEPIFIRSYVDVYRNIPMLSAEDQERFVQVHSIDESDYILEGYWNISGPMVPEAHPGFAPIHNIAVDGIPIRTIYKRTEPRFPDQQSPTDTSAMEMERVTPEFELAEFLADVEIDEFPND
jgi:hypothetical protein